jgi:hypothetical protein
MVLPTASTSLFRVCISPRASCIPTFSGRSLSWNLGFACGALPRAPSTVVHFYDASPGSRVGNPQARKRSDDANGRCLMTISIARAGSSAAGVGPSQVREGAMSGRDALIGSSETARSLPTADTRNGYIYTMAAYPSSSALLLYFSAASCVRSTCQSWTRLLRTRTDASLITLASLTLHDSSPSSSHE